MGTAGNLSARLADGTFWVTASGVDKGRMTVDDFLRTNLAGDVLEAPVGARPSAETSLHQAIYGWSSEAGACLHVHTPAANLATRLWDGDVPLPPIEMLKGLGLLEEEPRISAPVFPNRIRVPDIGRDVQTRFRQEQPQVPFFLIRDHGLTVWGKDVREAANRVECVAYILDIAVEGRRLGISWFPTLR